jgi:peptide/nickel transport system substrate-binding protein
MSIPSVPSRRLSRVVTVAAAAATLFAPAACATEVGAPSTTNDATLALAIHAAPNSLDPAQLAEGQEAYVWNSVFDTLLYADNKGQLQPNAAESWRYSEDGRTLTLKLRKGMTFSSGAPVDAGAVAGTMKRTRATPGQQQGKLAGVVSIEATDELTVVITLAKPDSSFLNVLSTGAGVIADPSTFNNKDLGLHPVGSGPYILNEGATVFSANYLLTRREDYWNAKAYPFKTLNIRVTTDPAASVNALETGEVNASSVEASQVQRLTAAGFDVAFVEGIAIGNLVLADRSGSVLKPLADLRVRQAINMAFDRKKMVDQLLHGAGKPSVQLFNPKGDAYDPTLEQTYSYDPAGAKRLLAAAGYANGFSVTMPSLYFTSTFEPSITQALGDIGITVQWEPVPPQTTISSIMSKKYPMFFFLDGLNIPSRDVQTNFTPTGYLNAFGTTDPEITPLINQVGAELDATKAAVLYRKINSLAVKSALDAPLFYVGTYWVTKKGIRYLGDGSLTFSTVRAFGVST